MKIKKILLGIVLGLSSIVSQAAPTDCKQLIEDGEIDCIKATSWFKYGSSGAPLRNTFEETIKDFETSWCSERKNTTCYLQYENNPSEPPEGRVLGSHGDIPYTQINYNSSSNGSGWAVVTYYSAYVPNMANKYNKQQSRVFHFRVCPENTTAISAGSDTYLQYCKPNPIPKNSSPSCDTGCNISSGNVSVGN